jgi:plasmid stabilization system protein ParE
VRILWAPSALLEIDRIIDYPAAVNPRVAIEVAEGPMMAADSLVECSDRGRPVPHTTCANW